MHIMIFYFTTGRRGHRLHSWKRGKSLGQGIGGGGKSRCEIWRESAEGGRQIRQRIWTQGGQGYGEGTEGCREGGIQGKI